MSGRYFLDTNILVYAHDASESVKQSKSQDLIYTAVRSRDGVISPQVLSEFFVTVTRKISNPLPEDQARKAVVLLSPLCTVDLDATLVLQALNVRVRWGVNYWDAMILAAAGRGGCPVLYSEDLSNGQHYGDVRVVNPYA